MADLSWFQRFPSLDEETLRAIRLAIDGSFRGFTREHGEMMERLFYPLRDFLLASEHLLTQSPWPLVMAGIAAVSWLASRSWKIVLAAMLALFWVGMFGMWQDLMKTLSMIFVSTVVAIVVGVPIGIWMSYSNRVQKVISPALDVMQTLPSFVYLIPVVMLLGIGRVPGLIAVVIYAIPPVIRFTNLGIRMVSSELLEAADAYGSARWQKMIQVQLPLALPTIMAGVNQTIMLALSMVVVASMIGVQGLGQPVLRAITNQYFAMGLFNGLAIVVIAILFDRLSQAYGQRLQKHREMSHG
jgi:glycine betaine/proline transport system permease protein